MIEREKMFVRQQKRKKPIKIFFKINFKMITFGAWNCGGGMSF